MLTAMERGPRRSRIPAHVNRPPELDLHRRRCTYIRLQTLGFDWYLFLRKLPLGTPQMIDIPSYLDCLLDFKGSL